MIEDFIVELAKLGWTLPVSAPAAAAIGVKTSPDHKNSSVFDEARALLAQIPNRDIEPNITRTNVDDWLDDYANWISVAYALIAFLGALANSPEALAIWIDWSDGRPQTQSSESVWRSALSQPLRFGPIGLIKLVRALVPASGQDFPELDPDDPLLQTKTPTWDALRERWAFCMAQGFVDMHTGSVIDKQAFTNGHAHLAPALRLELGVKKRLRPAVSDLFLSRSDHVRVFNITYAPGDPPFVPSRDPALPSFNTWRPTTILADRTVSEAQIKLWLDHVEFIMGSSSERDRFLRWCAFVAQHPERKPNWHFLIMSLQGLGKDMMVAPIKLAVGVANWCEELIYSLADNFNEVIEHKLLMVGETAQPKAGFVSAHDLGTRLKPLLAQPPTELKINKKYRTPYKIPNRLAVILFSNESNPLLLERGQRRVHVVNRLGVKSELLDYYWALNEWLQDGGAKLVASYLLAYPLSEAQMKEFIGGVAPETDAKAALEHQNTHPQLAALEDIIGDAREGVVNDTTPKALVATAEELVQFIKGKGLHAPSPQNIRTWLLDMEKQNTGVRRLKIDPKARHLCGVVGNGTHSGRLWLLGEAAPDGRAWSSMTNVEIIALWKNLPAPPNAKVIRYPAAGRKPNGGDYPADEEPV